MFHVSSLSRYIRNVQSRIVNRVAGTQYAKPKFLRTNMRGHPVLKRRIVSCGDPLPQKGVERLILRILRRPVLHEFRSGLDRRRRHLRETDVLEHVDVKV